VELARKKKGCSVHRGAANLVLKKKKRQKVFYSKETTQAKHFCYLLALKGGENRKGGGGVGGRRKEKKVSLFENRQTSSLHRGPTKGTVPKALEKLNKRKKKVSVGQELLIREDQHGTKGRLRNQRGGQEGSSVGGWFRGTLRGRCLDTSRLWKK